MEELVYVGKIQAQDADQLRSEMDLELEDSKKARASASILVIEDHELLLNRLVAILEKEGYRAYGASDGREGMRYYNEKHPDIILTDVNLPYKDGFEILREAKGSGRKVEIIVTSGSCEKNIEPRALKEGAIEFLRKPIDLEQMLAAIQEALQCLAYTAISQG